MKLVAFGAAMAFLLTGGAFARGATTTAATLTTDKAVASYLVSVGVNPKGVVIQRGKKNYAGPGCPGAAWNCTSARRVAQVSAGGINIVSCSGGTGTGAGTGTLGCTIVQSSTTGNNNASCIEASLVNAPTTVTQTCSIKQTSTSGANSATVQQTLQQGPLCGLVPSGVTSDQSQTGTQKADVTQTSASGAGTVSLKQEAWECVATFTGGSTSQKQTTDQNFSIQQVPAVFGGNPADCNVSTSALQAIASQAQHQTGFAPLAGSGTQLQHADLNGHIDQCSKGVATYKATQTEDQFLGKNSHLTQVQQGPTSLKGGKLTPQRGRTLSRGHCCSFQGTNGADTCTIVQKTSQQANASATQTEDLLAEAGTTGNCGANISSTQNAATNTSSSSGGTVSATLQCQSGTCGPTPTKLVWAGGTTGHYHGQGNLAATLTRADTNQPLAGMTVALKVDAADGCSAVTDSAGLASCPVFLTRTPSAVPYNATASFGGNSSFDVSSTTAAFTVTPQPTKLVYTGDTTKRYHESAHLAAVLTEVDSGEPVDFGTSPLTLTLTGSPDCTPLSTDSGTVSCDVTINQKPGGTYAAGASFAGNTFYVAANADPVTFTVTKRGTILTYDGPTNADYHHGVTLHATLTEDDPGKAPIAGETVTLTLGSAPSCTGVTDSTGGASCSITKITQVPGVVSASASFAAGDYYLGSSDSKSFTINKEHTTIVYSGSTSVDYSDTAPFKGTLYEDDGVTPISGVLVTFAVGGSSCSGTTSSTGLASCSTKVFEKSGATTVTATSAETALYLSGSTSKPFTVTIEESSISYTGPTTGKKNTNVTVSAKLSWDDGPISGRSVTFTLGSATCSGTTNASGVASCSLATGSSTGTFTLKAAFAGDDYFEPRSVSVSFKVTS